MYEIVTTYYDDTENRVQNLNKFIDHYKEFNAKIHLISNKEIELPNNFVLHVIDEGFYNRTALLNKAYSYVNEKIVCSIDIDIIINETDLEKSVNECIKHKFVIPFNKVFNKDDNGLQEINMFHASYATVKVGTEHTNPWPFNYDITYPSFVGFIFVFDKDEYEKLGFENKNIIGWGFDDLERYSRISKFYKIHFSNNSIIHNNHPYVNSKAFDFIENNIKEWYKVESLSKEELLSYIRINLL